MNMVWEQLAPERILLGVPAIGREEVLERIGGALVREGYCKNSFVEALVKREAENPTGIDMAGFGIAIPHTDISHVNKNGLAIGILEKSVPFVAMGTDDEYVEARVVFVLAITDKNGHLDLMRALLRVLQDKSVLERLRDAKSAEEIIDIIKRKENAA
jgi:PTS system galactitol-specific IIA component